MISTPVDQTLKDFTSTFRVKLMNPTKSPQNLGFGFSSSVAILVWAVWGGFVLHIMLSNYLAVLMKPSYEKPINTVDDYIS